MTAAGRRAVRNPETALAHNVKTKRNTGTQWVACMGAQLLGGGGGEKERWELGGGRWPDLTTSVCMPTIK